MISIQLNGEEKKLPETLTLSQFLQENQIQTPAIAVAVNAEIIPRSEFEKIKLQDNDRVEIIHAVGGG